MGFDDMELAEYSEPPLSTIAVDKLAIGTEAAVLALRCMRNEQPLPSGTCVLPVRLIERSSTQRRETAHHPAQILRQALNSAQS